ncbi:phenazine biosynthesis FMN-dependent oxidase PhzG [Streptomyces botrytidirepellens]|uniref:Pyridoxamine 5'-phosphate oxidase n=1 Tax=Streptomyces botrytidirepellens TaxID=2486417 RepID=A0A3M8W1H3_9ACTN|nr:phenazine biosynthesis FMN-dependent oxidase PhzG [Streptomyces botrytidirepellens]RNG22589.1 pyridoxamine 5'-phosphate oxidase [Streptomyces botrytidirepellens]
MTTARSETLTGTVDILFPEFHAPPADPVPLLRAWFDEAVRLGVREQRALALATAGTDGRPSTRMVALNRIEDDGFVFATHVGSRKGREMTANPWASVVLYWRETSQQLVVTGAVERLSTAVADELWFSRPPFTHPMSVAARQSEELHDLDALRAEVARLAQHGDPLPRPEGYAGFLLRFDALEFWANGADRLHERLVYERSGDGWRTRRLQP